jgi:hypothetical protein
MCYIIGYVSRGKHSNSFPSYHIPPTPASSSSYALFCATVSNHLFCFQSLPNSFCCHGGWYPSRQVFVASELAALRSPLFSRCYKLFLLFRTTRLARFPSICLPLPSTQTNERSRRCFPADKTQILTWRCPHSMLYIAIQCAETPFGERFGAIPPTPVD